MGPNQQQHYHSHDDPSQRGFLASGLKSVIYTDPNQQGRDS